MPIYEYACAKCGNVFSVLRLASSQEKTTCPSCGSGDVSKRMSVFGCTIHGGHGGRGGLSGSSGGFSAGG
jgi:putative FmdB family regulatory protein